MLPLNIEIFLPQYGQNLTPDAATHPEGESQEKISNMPSSSQIPYSVSSPHEQKYLFASSILKFFQAGFLQLYGIFVIISVFTVGDAVRIAGGLINLLVYLFSSERILPWRYRVDHGL